MSTRRAAASHGAAGRKAPKPTAAASSRDESKEAPQSDTEDEAGDEQPTQSNSFNVPARFAGQSIYEVLNVPKDATSDVIKKAYRRMALLCHPDLNKSPSATEEFQYLSRCHEILSDATKRARYDASGNVDDIGSESEESIDAYEYWRTIFPKITIEDIEAYRAKYEGSEEEKEDATQAFHEHDGDLESVYQSIPFASRASLPRLCRVISSAIGRTAWTAKEVKEFTKRLAAEEEGEAAEAEAAMAELSAKEQALMRNDARSKGGASTDGLALILQQRARDRAASGQAFLAQMESKYAAMESVDKKSKTGSKKTAGKSQAKKANSKRKGKEVVEEDDEADTDGDAPMNEPTDAEFEAIQAAMIARKKAKTGK